MINKILFCVFAYVFVFASSSIADGGVDLTVSKIRAVSFGSHYLSGSTGSTTVSVAGEISTGVGDTYVSGANNGAVTFTSSQNTNIVYIVPSSVTMVGLKTGAVLNVSLITTDKASPMVIARNGSINLRIGATFSYSGNIPADNYVGTIQLRYKENTDSIYQTVSVSINCNVLPSLSLALTSNLNFGSIGMNYSGGSVRLSPSGIVSNISGSSDLLPSPRNAGSVEIYGNPNAFVNVSFSQNNYLSNGASTINLTNLTSNISSPVTLNSTGKAIISIGGDIVYGLGQIAGSYTGSYTIMANY